MTKKKTTFKCPQLVPNKKKDILKIVNNPEAMKRLIELNKSAAAVLENQEKKRAKNIDEWLVRAFSFLPEEFDDKKTREMIERIIKGELLNDSCDERKTSDD